MNLADKINPGKPCNFQGLIATEFSEKQLDVFCTTRNLKTCKKLVELSRDITF